MSGRPGHAARAASFGRVAGSYERARPGYPPEAVRWLTGEGSRDVLDLAAGTGKLTRGLVEIGHRVVAVDPATEMLEVIGRELPEVVLRAGSAEAIPLEDASVDVVTVAQAFHWFEPAAAYREIARVLRPGGLLGLVWNVRDTSLAHVRRLGQIIGSGEARAGQAPPAGAGNAGFGPFRRAEFRHGTLLTLPALLDLVRSRSYCAVLDEPERAAVLARVEALYHESATAEGFPLPYRTRVFQATLLPA